MEEDKNSTIVSQEASIPEGVLKREQERILALEKRQEEKKEKESDGFNTTFHENHNRIRSMLSEIERGEIVDREELKEKFADISKQILLLNHIIVDAKIFLASYDMKTYNKKLLELTEECNSLEAKVLPRKKFGFKKVEKVKSNAEKDISKNSDLKAGNKDIVDYVKSISQFGQQRDIGFYNKIGETLELFSGEIFKKPVSLSNIDSCIVKLNGNASTVHINNINKSEIYLGPVSNSVFIENCNDTTLHLACHQLRLHTSYNCRVYLYVTSRPIIEHCKNIGFGPTVKFHEELFELSGLEKEKNHWNEVDDFNWLSVEEKSPNWFEMKE